MKIGILILGIFILIIVNVDALSTILRLNGGSKISNFISGQVWKVFLFLSGKNAKSNILNNAGGFILITLFISWALLLWIGFGLIFMFDYHSLVITSTEVPANCMGKFYYVGYTLTSLGNGDLKAGSDLWRIVSNLMGFNGMFLLTLTISYFIPVMNAAIKQRVLASTIAVMGNTPDKIILNGWNGNSFDHIYDKLKQLHSFILEHAQKHQAYPVLFFFHSTSPQYSVQLNIAKLDEALNIQEIYGLDKTANCYLWDDLRKALDEYRKIMSNAYAFQEKKAPAFEYRHKIESLLPSAPDDEVKRKLELLEDRRSFFAALIQKVAWKWTDVVNDSN